MDFFNNIFFNTMALFVVVPFFSLPLQMKTYPQNNLQLNNYFTKRKKSKISGLVFPEGKKYILEGSRTSSNHISSPSDDSPNHFVSLWSEPNDLQESLSLPALYHHKFNHCNTT